MSADIQGRGAGEGGACASGVWNNIPQRLRNLRQWFCWKYGERNGTPTKVPYDLRTGYPGSVTDPANWHSFQDACTCLAMGYDGIGFAFKEGGGLVGIDLDDKLSDPATPDDLALFAAIHENFGTYTERSVGGRGIHIIAEGKLPEGLMGRKVGHIEVYAANHYFTFSGNINLEGLRFIPETYQPIMTVENCQADIDILVARLNFGAAPYNHSEAVDSTQRRTLAEIGNAIDSADNRDRIISLYKGEWNQLYPTQSEADLAFVQDLMFYGAINEQAVTLWLQSALSPHKRQGKKKHPSYIKRTINTARHIWNNDEAARLIRQAEAQKQADALAASTAQDLAFQKQVELNRRMKAQDERAAARYQAKQKKPD